VSPAFRLEFTPTARSQLEALKSTKPEKYKKVGKTLHYLESNPRHPGLQTHEFRSLAGPAREKVYEAYVENRTPAAFRVFWCYKRDHPGVITIVAITPHP
jgi:mRNA-degrading endonuclease RelE of RelBE toxin-antitoxin system